jgi:hypothetical protein
MCSLCIKTIFYGVGRVRFASNCYQTCSIRIKNGFLSLYYVRFALKIIFLLSNMFAWLRYQRKHYYRSFPSLCFDIVAITIFATQVCVILHQRERSP